MFGPLSGDDSISNEMKFVGELIGSGFFFLHGLHGSQFEGIIPTELMGFTYTDVNICIFVYAFCIQIFQLSAKFNVKLQYI